MRKDERYHISTKTSQARAAANVSRLPPLWDSRVFTTFSELLGRYRIVTGQFLQSVACNREADR